jgi:amino acid adenylation domain-containing protein
MIRHLETFFFHGKEVSPFLSTTHALFEEQTKLTPHKEAIIFNGETVTYQQLNRQANQLSALLSSHNIKKGDRVGVFLNRGPKVIAAMLAILKIGGAFLLIETSYPQKRIDFIIKDSKLACLLTDNFTLNLIDNSIEKSTSVLNIENLLISNNRELQNPAVPVSGNDVAYIIYTSGTTSTPKGVLIEHQALLNTLLNQIEILKLNAADNILCAASVSFDASIWEIGGCLLSGATSYLVNDHDRKSIKKLSQLMQENPISVATFTPSILRLFTKKTLSNLRVLVSAGESCTTDLLDKIDSNCLFFNAYGPSEASICATIHLCKKKDKMISIGKPLKNVTIHLLSNDLRPTASGEIGTLYIGGIGLAKGYLNNKCLTHNKFTLHTHTRERLYNSGDLVRCHPDGALEYIGRQDQEVNICGKRVNLNEINHLLMQHKKIKKSLVKAVNNPKNTRKHLIAVIEVDDMLLDEKEIKEYLSAFLPSYMIPSKLIKTKYLPLSLSGKIKQPACINS